MGTSWSERVKKLRVAMGMTQEGFAAAMACSVFTISQWERKPETWRGPRNRKLREKFLGLEKAHDS